MPGFFAGAEELRRVFDDRHGQRTNAADHRFVWDYWHIPGQYTYVRTPAKRFFPAPLFADFLERLCGWGADTLGCPTIHTCWLSFYVDGCGQGLHTDVRHGPWAFSFSLTRWEGRRFEGGETLLLRPEVLDFWRQGAEVQLKSERFGATQTTLFDQFPATFNQLLVFDGRVPHAVAPVSGTRDPQEGRVVLHGWFAAPTIQASGAVSGPEAAAVVADAYPALAARLERFGQADGVLVARLHLGRDGRALRVEPLTDSLETTSADLSEREDLVDAIVAFLKELRFPARDEAATVTVPIAASR